MKHVVAFFLVVACLFSLFSSAHAEGAHKLPDQQPISLRVRELAEEIDFKSTYGGSRPKDIQGSIKKLLPKAGRYVAYGGNILFAASLVSDALKWFYNQSQASINPALDDWWSSGVSIKIPPPDKIPFEGTEMSSNPEIVSFKVGRYMNIYNYTPMVLGIGGTTQLYQTYDMIRERAAYYQSVGRAESLARTKTLSQVIDSDPSVAGDMKKIVVEYVSKFPESVKPYLNPMPNENQWQDNPYADPNLDTGGKGMSDAAAFDRSGQLIDPDSISILDRKLHEVGKETSTVRNSDGSVTKTVTTKYGDGTKSAVAVTTKTFTETKPDNSTVKTTVTTTETTDVGGKTSARTQTEVETLPLTDKDAGEKQRDPNASGSNICGDFSMSRLLAYPGSYIKDVIFPCEDLGEFFRPLLDAASTKYPFALTNSLSNLVKTPGSGDQASTLPSKLGPFELDWSWIAPLITIIGLLYKGAVSWMAVDLVLSRLMGQVVIK